MNANTIKKNVKNWAEAIQPEAALIKLLTAGLSSRASEQLINGTYKHRIRASTIRKLNKAMGD